MTWGERFLFGSIALALIASIGLVALLPFAIYWDNKQVEKWDDQCKMKGGELLEHTYKVGKHTYDNYICVDPKVIIPYGEN